MDFDAAGLLDGLDGEDRASRQQLLEQLASDGFSLKELRTAVAEDRLALLPVERVLGGRYTAKEIAAKSGVPAEWALRVRRAIGFPDVKAGDRVFAEEDIAAAKSLKLFLDAGLPEETILEITRVLGEGTSRLASTITGEFADAFLEPGDTERDVALRYAAMAEALLPSMTPVLVAALGQHIRASAQRGVIGRSERERGQLSGEEQLVVGFADLVGFTSLGGEIGALELGTVARRLAELAAEVATPPVRLVKTIGDAAMFVSPTAEQLVDAALSLVEAVDEAGLPILRAGVASGPALLRAGDFYGHSVNLASRVTGIARPGSVLCTEDVRDAAPEHFEWSFAGRHRLKGVAEPVALHRARRLPGTEPAAGRPPERPQRGPRDAKKPREPRRPKADRPRRRASR
jgi:adenylate cyclase